MKQFRIYLILILFLFIGFEGCAPAKLQQKNGSSSGSSGHASAF